jgi:hypothetical protein
MMSKKINEIEQRLSKIEQQLESVGQKIDSSLYAEMQSELGDIRIRVHDVQDRVYDIKFVEERLEHYIQDYYSGEAALLQLYRNLRDTTIFSEYLRYLNLIPEKIMLVAVCDTAGCMYTEKHDRLMHQLGSKIDLLGNHWKGYVLVIENNEVLYEQVGEVNKTVEIAMKLDDISLVMKSSPFNAENCANIEINGFDCAVNKRGINIVTYHPTDGYFIDSVSFDTHAMGIPCYRQEM